LRARALSDSRRDASEAPRRKTIVEGTGESPSEGPARRPHELDLDWKNWGRERGGGGSFEEPEPGSGGRKTSAWGNIGGATGESSRKEGRAVRPEKGVIRERGKPASASILLADAVRLLRGENRSCVCSEGGKSVEGRRESTLQGTASVRNLSSISRGEVARGKPPYSTIEERGIFLRRVCGNFLPLLSWGEAGNSTVGQNDGEKGVRIKVHAREKKGTRESSKKKKGKKENLSI